MPYGSELFVLTMKKTGFISLLVSAALCSVSCGGELDLLGMFWTLSDTPDERFAQSMEFNSSHAPIVLDIPGEDYRVYVFSDAHVQGKSENLSRFVSGYLSNDEDAPFCIYLGDAIDCKGNYDAFMDQISPILNSGRDTLFCTPGNHDIYYDQWKDYVARFKTSCYQFEVLTPQGHRDLFLCLDSSSGSLGRDQLQWIRSTLENASKAGYRHITIFTHTHLFKKDASQGHTSNYEMEETYELTGLFRRTGVDLVLAGHDHSREYTMFGGVEYYVIDAIKDGCEDPSYAIASYGDDTITVNYLPLIS